MKAFVTGATGFLGSHIARVLVEQGAELRLLVRRTSDLRNIADLSADRVNAFLAHCRLVMELFEAGQKVQIRQTQRQP